MLTRLIATLEEKKQRARDWFLSFSKKPRASAWLSFFAFLEASVFPLPPDILQIALTLAHSTRWAWYALLTAGFSVLGGIAGYLIGAVFFKAIGAPIIQLYGLEETMAHVGNAFSENAFWTLFTAAFTPIPYKVFTIASGFFDINIASLVIASLVGRGLRFFGIGFLSYRYGETLRYLIYRYFNIASFLFILAIVAALFIL